MRTALVLACDDNFVPFTSIVARQISHQASEKFPIIVVSDGVTDENKALARQVCPQISFIEASHLFTGVTLPVGRHFTRATYLRLTLDKILADFDRAVYLDSDVSVVADLSPLVGLKPRAAPVVVSYDLILPLDITTRTRLGMSAGAPHFNGGVAVYDLKAIRHERIFEQALDFAQQNPERCEIVDQDALNVVLDGRWQVLDWRWNAMTFRVDGFPSKPYIRHFAGLCKPWTADKRNIESIHISQWRKDLTNCPWPGRFKEAPLKRTANYFLRRYVGPIENTMRSLLYSRSQGVRGAKVRFNRRYPLALREIEAEASEGQLARRFPERTLFGAESA